MDHERPEYEMPRGRRARQAWQALSPQARQAAFAAANRGVAPPDLGLAWVAAGYGRTVARRMRLAWLLAPVATLILAIPVGVALVGARASVRAVDAAMAALLVVVFGGLVGLSVWARRYQRLHTSGLLGMEAARLGSLAPTPGPSMWDSSSTESGFTVPYHAQVPAPAPVARPAPDPVGTGVREVPLGRGRVLASLAVLLAFAVVLWLCVALLRGVSSQPILPTLIGVLAAVYTLGLVFLLYAAAPALRWPIAARFTPAGWEIPAQRMSGSWAEVRAIRVRPLSAAGWTAGSARLNAVRVVTLIVDNPEQHIAQRGAVRRAMVRSNIKKYGSPVAIVAMPRRSIAVVDLVRLLQRYTSAPVEWSGVNGSVDARS